MWVRDHLCLLLAPLPERGIHTIAIQILKHRDWRKLWYPSIALYETKIIHTMPKLRTQDYKECQTQPIVRYIGTFQLAFDSWQKDQRVKYYNFDQNPTNHNFDPRDPFSHGVRAKTAVSLVLPLQVVWLNPESENLQRPLRFRPACRLEGKTRGRGVVEATPARAG